MKKAVIIGSGIGGLGAAVRLAVKGYDVQVLEANAYPGGKLSEINIDGYRFDAGPSLFTLPELVDELFVLAGKRSSDYFKYQKLDINCHYFYEDGLQLHAFADRERLLDEFDTKTADDRATIAAALDKSQELYEILAELFMYRSMHHWSTFLNKKAFQAYSKLHRLDFFRTMNKANETRFKDPRVTQLFNRYATYNGSDPYQTPATLNIIPHLEFNIGAFFPDKGMHDITMSIYGLAKELGVNFLFNHPVEKIILESKKAVGVVCLGQQIMGDLVVSNMDIVNTYRKLMTDIDPPELLLKQPKSSSALIFYWGIQGQFEQLGLHNIFFSKDYQKEFRHIFKEGNITDDPTVYVNITSKYKSDDAPKGCENWFTMINVPNNQGQDWEVLIDNARSNIIKKLSRIIGRDIGELITCEEILDPRTIESKTSSSLGALYGNSSNNKYAAFLRHANFSRKYKNLYFCGGSVHPGGGIPLSLLSARIMAEELPDLRVPAG
ncbi:MAG: 1-hydroxycarotenoid 3,4-desaturase CrtD [Cyclobacteriaceae bacterium]